MAVLADAERVIAWAELMRAADVPGNIVKADLRAAINAVDDWVEANATAFNTAIPQPARGALTAKQKAKLLMFVVERRFGVL